MMFCNLRCGASQLFLIISILKYLYILDLEAEGRSILSDLAATSLGLMYVILHSD